jgi:hypothetical protein
MARARRLRKAARSRIRRAVGQGMAAEGRGSEAREANGGRNCGRIEKFEP